jgi:hypothetical protein
MIKIQRPSVRVTGAALIGVMVLGSAVGAEAATHKKKAAKKPVKVTRTVTFQYTGGCSVETPAVGLSSPVACSSFGAGGWVIPTKAGEKYATVSVVDNSGRTIGGAFWEPGGAGGTSVTTDFCGSLKDYAVPVGGSVTLKLDAVLVATDCPGIATQGTVKVAFSNLP